MTTLPEPRVSQPAPSPGRFAPHQQHHKVVLSVPLDDLRKILGVPDEAEVISASLDMGSEFLFVTVRGRWPKVSAPTPTGIRPVNRYWPRALWSEQPVAASTL